MRISDHTSLHSLRLHDRIVNPLIAHARVQWEDCVARHRNTPWNHPRPLLEVNFYKVVNVTWHDGRACCFMAEHDTNTYARLQVFAELVLLLQPVIVFVGLGLGSAFTGRQHRISLTCTTTLFGCSSTVSCALYLISVQVALWWDVEVLRYAASGCFLRVGYHADKLPLPKACHFRDAPNEQGFNRQLFRNTH